MKEILLTQGKVALVDDADYERVNQHKWCANKIGNNWYAIRATGGRRKKKFIYMHRSITAVAPGMYVDHRNHNGLDNRRENLRVCTNAQNTRSRGTGKNNTSGYKGVCWRKDRKRWSAKIKVNYVTIALGCFGSPEEAAKAYDEAARFHFGEYALTNFQIKTR